MGVTTFSFVLSPGVDSAFQGGLYGGFTEMHREGGLSDPSLRGAWLLVKPPHLHVSRSWETMKFQFIFAWLGWRPQGKSYSGPGSTPWAPGEFSILTITNCPAGGPLTLKWPGLGFNHPFITSKEEDDLNYPVPYFWKWNSSGLVSAMWRLFFPTLF